MSEKKTHMVFGKTKSPLQLAVERAREKIKEADKKRREEHQAFMKILKKRMLMAQEEAQARDRKKIEVSIASKKLTS